MLDTALGDGQMVPCRTHVLLADGGHLGLCSQPCVMGSWATVRRCIADGVEGLGVPFSLFSVCGKMLAGVWGRAGARWVSWACAAPEPGCSKLEALPVCSTGCHHTGLQVLCCLR